VGVGYWFGKRVTPGIPLGLCTKHTPLALDITTVTLFCMLQDYEEYAVEKVLLIELDLIETDTKEV